MSTVLLIGANRGIGLAYAQHYAARGDTVYGTARNPVTATELAEVATVLPCDVQSDQSTAALADAVADVRFDVVIYNAGVLELGGLDQGSAQSLSRQLDINAVGAFRVLHALAPLLRGHDTTIGIMTSRMGSIADNTSGGMYGYRASKAALNAIGKSLAIDLAPLPVLLLHPGMVRTGMTGGHGDVDPAEAAAALIGILDAAGPEQSGRFWHRDGYELPW